MSTTPCQNDTPPPGPGTMVYTDCIFVCDAHLEASDVGEKIYVEPELAENCDLDCYWHTDGNNDSELIPGHFIGPTNGDDFIIKTGDESQGLLDERMKVSANGQVVIGEKTVKSPPDAGLENHTDFKLAVYGKIVTNEIVGLPSADDIEGNNYWESWPDYVFEDDYELMPLLELEKEINKNKCLPEIPSKDKVNKEGVNIVEMQAKLLKKVEEITLYMIQLKKENEELKRIINDMEKK